MQPYLSHELQNLLSERFWGVSGPLPDLPPENPAVLRMACSRRILILDIWTALVYGVPDTSCRKCTQPSLLFLLAVLSLQSGRIKAHKRKEISSGHRQVVPGNAVEQTGVPAGVPKNLPFVFTIDTLTDKGVLHRPGVIRNLM